MATLLNLMCNEFPTVGGENSEALVETQTGKDVGDTQVTQASHMPSER